jgi:hypothetical protein
MGARLLEACLAGCLTAGATSDAARGSDPAPASGAEQSQEALSTGIENQELFGYVLRDSRWSRLRIHVCWEDFEPSDAAARAIVQQAVSSSWEANSGVRFVGWTRCAAMAQGIRIRVADETPEVKALGKYLDARPAGMVLNFTFARWWPKNRPQCAQTRDICLRATAVHEFGHALGFSHEQNRPEAPDQCRELRQGAEGDYRVTEYDPGSIMNYCNANWSGDGTLSKLDVTALQTFYGAA